MLPLLKVEAQGHLYPLQLFQTEENVFPLDVSAQMIKLVEPHQPAVKLLCRSDSSGRTQLIIVTGRKSSKPVATAV